MACGCKSGSNELNTVTCGGTTPCSPSVASTCNPGSGCRCNSNPCQCGNGGCVTSAPTPFYNQAGGVQENHNTTVVQQQFVTSLTTSSAFNVPACEENATITIPGLQKIQIGSYLWNSVYGYFQVISFDYLSSQVTIKNTCIASCVEGVTYASPGSAVPSCTQFNVVDPPCGSGGGVPSGVFLAVDFVAPAVGNCIDISVTSVAGIFVGQNVQVGSGIYRVSGVADSTTITICNDGAGIVHGTIVYAKDASNQFITPITPLSTNACTNPVNATGALLTCHNNIQGPLEGGVLGQVPVLINTTTNEVQFQTLAIPVEVCTVLGADITLVAGTTIYTILVSDSSIFSVIAPPTGPQLAVIHFGTYENARWKVNAIPDGTHVTIEKTTAQTVNDVIPDGSQVCIAPCCDQVSSALNNTNTNVATNTSAIAAINGSFVFADYTPVISAIGGTISAVTVTGRYIAIGKLVIAYVQIAFTSGGANNITSVIATLPATSVTVTPAGTHKNVGSALSLDPGGTDRVCTAFIIPGAETQVVINNNGDTAYTVGAQKLNATIIYEKV